VTLGAIARETTTLRLGTMVCSATFRLPGPLAVTVAQVDQMSGGRVDFGIGAGWYDVEHVAYGIPFPSTNERFERLEEQLQIITGMWRALPGDQFSFEGQHYTIVGSPALPKPLQPGGPPIIIGGHGKRRTPRLAATYAAEFNQPFPQVDDYRAQVKVVREACETIGRDPDDLFYSVALTVCCGESEEELGLRAGKLGLRLEDLRATAAAGRPSEVIDRIADFVDAGAQRVYLQLLDCSDVEQVHLLADRVVKVLP